jgi:hypothetical protein
MTIETEIVGPAETAPKATSRKKKPGPRAGREAFVKVYDAIGEMPPQAALILLETASSLRSCPNRAELLDLLGKLLFLDPKDHASLVVLTKVRAS